MFDNDDVGRKVVEECVLLLILGKVKIVLLFEKDVSDMLVIGKVKMLVDVVWLVKIFRFDGIILGIDFWEVIIEEDNVEVVSYLFNGLNEKIFGMCRGEIVMVIVGFGIGKLYLICEFVYYLVKEG